jgi:CheY-like chemotaxis protein
LLVELEDAHFRGDGMGDGMGDGLGDTTLKAGHYVVLSVSDTGTGFSDEALGHAFEPFFTTKEAGRGTGLGLATVYGIATDAGGDIQLRSEPGVGTTIRVFLPVAAQSGAEAPARPLSAAPDDAGALVLGVGQTVLLAEDQAQLRAVTSRILERSGFTVRAVGAASEAVDLLATSHPFSLLLTDMVMPGMSGLQLAERAAALRPGLPIVFMSGFSRGMWESAEAGSGGRILRKPFDADQLLRRVGEALSEARPPLDRSVRAIGR